jgi:hypothetical protein
MFRIFKKEKERTKEKETKNHEKNSKTKKPEKKEKTQAAAVLTGRPSIVPTRVERGSVPLTGGA